MTDSDRAEFIKRLMQEGIREEPAPAIVELEDEEPMLVVKAGKPKAVGLREPIRVVLASEPLTGLEGVKLIEPTLVQEKGRKPAANVRIAGSAGRVVAPRRKPSHGTRAVKKAP